MATPLVGVVNGCVAADVVGFHPLVILVVSNWQTMLATTLYTRVVVGRMYWSVSSGGTRVVPCVNTAITGYDYIINVDCVCKVYTFTVLQ